jgi:hypothetical protein
VTERGERMLLAVDIGLRSGLALYGDDGRLRWYRSSNFGNRTRCRHAVYGLLGDLPGLSLLILEGGGPIADIWVRAAGRQGIEVKQISAEQWRTDLLYRREQRKGTEAKKHADTLARRVIAWAKAPRPTSLRHDAAEAILVGLWGVNHIGWLPEFPAELRR